MSLPLQSGIPMREVQPLESKSAHGVWKKTVMWQKKTVVRQQWTRPAVQSHNQTMCLIVILRMRFILCTQNTKIILNLKLDDKLELLRTCARELREAADIIKAQLPHHNRVWINSMVDRNIGGDVSQLVKYIRHMESTGRCRRNTWPRTGDREAIRCSRNTMGYQLRDCASLQPHG